MDFWSAYKLLREEHCKRAEEVSFGAEVSIHTVMAWDRQARNPQDDHGRNPNYWSRVRLARLAEDKGAPKKLVEALKPTAADGGDTAINPS